MSLLRELFGPSREEIWSLLAAQVNGQFTSGGWLGSDRVQAATGDWIVTLDTINESKTTWTRVRAPFLNRDGFRFTVYRAGFFTPLGKLFGIQDIEIGEPFFDPEFVVQGNNSQKVVELLANERIRALLKQIPQVYLTVQDDEGWFGGAFPAGVDQLLFKVQGVITNLDHLRAIYDLFSEILNRLCHLDSAYKDDLTLHLEALQGPGGRIRQQEVLLWDGEAPRIRAARALSGRSDPTTLAALFHVLSQSERELQLAVIHTLGQSGAPIAVSHLIPYLGDGQPTPWTPLRQAAQEALRRLGQAELVNAFGAVLRGNTDSLSQLPAPHRPRFVVALCAALHSEDHTEAVSAAQALAVWGALEALPDLREAVRRLRRSNAAAAKAVDLAVQALEKHTALPRPSEAAAASAESLPRPAAAAKSTGRDLPRPSGGHS